MALSNQPYLPLYVNDWLGNTKLRSCSAVAHGIMINVMLLMHKEDDYGKILLKQKFKQTDKQILNFASQFAKILPFDLLEIEAGLSELFDEKILFFDEDFMICNRMVRDAEISEKRALSGSKGGFSTQKINGKTGKMAPKNFAKAKSKANTDIDIDIDIEYDIKDKNICEIEKIFEQWLKYKIDRRESYKTKDSRTIAFNKLLKYSQHNPVIAAEIIDTAIGNNWAGFFELKISPAKKQTSRFTR